MIMTEAPTETPTEPKRRSEPAPSKPVRQPAPTPRRDPSPIPGPDVDPLPGICPIRKSLSLEGASLPSRDNL